MFVVVGRRAMEISDPSLLGVQEATTTSTIMHAEGRIQRWGGGSGSSPHIHTGAVESLEPHKFLGKVL